MLQTILVSTKALSWQYCAFNNAWGITHGSGEYPAFITVYNKWNINMKIKACTRLDISDSPHMCLFHSKWVFCNCIFQSSNFDSIFQYQNYKKLLPRYGCNSKVRGKLNDRFNRVWKHKCNILIKIINMMKNR